MTDYKKRLIGALIGLARATDGNEHLISKASTDVILECLMAEPTDEEELGLLLGKIDTVKRSMVPDCFLCANPCGRTSSYDMTQLENAPPEIRKIKYDILSKLQRLALGNLNHLDELSLYHSLVALGLDDLCALSNNEIL